MTYVDRLDAGNRLAHALRYLKGKDTVVVALPRGGVVVAAEVAKELKTPLDLILVKKIGHPNHEEYAIGAIAEDGTTVYNQSEKQNIYHEWLEMAEARALQLIKQREQLYFGEDVRRTPLVDKTVLVIDDGIATGYTMEAAVHYARSKGAGRVIVAVPVAPSSSIQRIEKLADEVIVLDDPAYFAGAVGNHYKNFNQVDDEEVATTLKEASHEPLQKNAVN